MFFLIDLLSAARINQLPSHHSKGAFCTHAVSTPATQTQTQTHHFASSMVTHVGMEGAKAAAPIAMERVKAILSFMLITCMVRACT